MGTPPSHRIRIQPTPARERRMAPNRNNVVSVGLLRAPHGEAIRTSRATRWSNALRDVVTSARTQIVTVGGFLCSQGRRPPDGIPGPHESTPQSTFRPIRPPADRTMSGLTHRAVPRQSPTAVLRGISMPGALLPLRRRALKSRRHQPHAPAVPQRGIAVQLSWHQVFWVRRGRAAVCR